MFIGEVVEVDYDSEDIEKVEPVYVVEYTDGDREDMDHDELQYAHEFHLARLGIDVENESCSAGSNDEESYRPSPKVCPFHLPPPLPSTNYILCFMQKKGRKANVSHINYCPEKR